MKKRLSNFLYHLSTDSGIGTLLIIFSILWVVLIFQMKVKSNAFEPLTEADYKWLHEQEEMLENDFEEVYSIEGAQLKVQDSKIVVTLTSRESKYYELEMTFNQNKEKLKVEEICHKNGYQKNTASMSPIIDKYWPKIECILGGILLGAVSAIMIGYLYRFLYRIIKRKI